MTPPITEAQLRQALRTYAADLTATHATPPASLIWLRARYQAQRQARQQALARATLPLRIMQTIGLLFAVATCAWCLHQAHISESAPLPASLLFASVLATLMVIAGSWVLLRSDRTPPRPANH